MSGAMKRRPRFLHRDRASFPALLVVAAFLVAADRGVFGDAVRLACSDVRNDGPNVADSDQLTRDYYRGLLGEGVVMRAGVLRRVANNLLFGAGEAEVDDEDFFESAISRASDGFAFRELVPDTAIDHRGVRVATNEFAMRDDPCTVERTPGVPRIALVGASNDMGWGVAHEETYEARLETLLPAALGREGVQRVEVLNFAVPGHTLLEHLWQVEESVARFAPDLVLVSVTLPDLRSRMLERLSTRVRAGRDLHFDFVAELVARAGAGRGDRAVDLWRKLEPFTDAIVRGAMEHLATIARARGLPVALLVLKLDPGTSVHPKMRTAAAAAERAGVPAIEVFDALAEFSADESYVDTRADHHPSSAAHAALAAEIARDVAADPRLAALLR